MGTAAEERLRLSKDVIEVVTLVIAAVVALAGFGWGIFTWLDARDEKPEVEIANFGLTAPLPNATHRLTVWVVANTGIGTAVGCQALVQDVAPGTGLPEAYPPTTTDVVPFALGPGASRETWIDLYPKLYSSRDSEGRIIFEAWVECLHPLTVSDSRFVTVDPLRNVWRPAAVHRRSPGVAASQRPWPRQQAVNQSISPDQCLVDSERICVMAATLISK